MLPKESISAAIICALLALSACGPAPHQPQPVDKQPAPDPVTAATAQDLTAAVEEIFTVSCARSGCHAGANPESGMSLEATRYLSDTVDVPARQLETMVRILRGEPDRSYLVHKVRGTHDTVGGRGNQMPPSGTPLPLESIQTIEAWVTSLSLPVDLDEDGSGSDVDCNDADPDIHAGAEDITGNTVDEDCSGSALDADADGYHSSADGGADADDNDPTTHPDAPELCFDDADNDQDGTVDEECVADADEDGHNSIAAGGDDADDNDATVYPGAPEVCGDGKDNDQNGTAEDTCNLNDDADGDGETENQGDCNDDDYAISTTATEVNGNTVDENCDGIVADRDNDGHLATDDGGDDCNDTLAAVRPGATDIPDDGIDQDCDEQDATLMTFSRIKTEILTVYGCAASTCHGSASPPEGLSLSAANAYTNLYNVASGQVPSMMRVKPSDPDSSYLLHKLKGTQATVGGNGMRMPRFGPTYLTPLQIIQVTNWISHGAQNN